MDLFALLGFIKSLTSIEYSHNVARHPFNFFPVTYLRAFAVSMRDLLCHPQSPAHFATKRVGVKARSMIGGRILITMAKTISNSRKQKADSAAGHSLSLLN